MVGKAAVTEPWAPALNWVPCGCGRVKADHLTPSHRRDSASALARSSGLILDMASSSSRSPFPAFLATRCHLKPSTLSIGTPRAADQHPCQAVLGDRAALPGRLGEQGHRGGLVLRRAGAIVERDGVFDLGVDIVGERGGLQQPDRLFDVFRHAGAFLVEGRERVLRFRVPCVRGDAQQFSRAPQVLRQCLAVQIKQREVIRGLGIAELGRGGHQFHGFLAVDRAAAAAEPHHGQREHAFAVAAVGGALVPLGRFRIVALDAERIGGEFPQHGHRLGSPVCSARLVASS